MQHNSLKMNDVRLNWIKQRLYELLNITNDGVFSEFLERDEGKFKDELLRYLSQTRDGSEIAVLFYKVNREEEERIEVEITETEPAESRQSLLAPNAPELTPSLLSVSVEGSDISGASSAMSDMKGKKGKGRKAKGSKKKAEEEAKRAAEEAAAKAAAEAELQQQQEEEDKGPRMKTIIQKVWREYLYMVSGVDITFELVAQMNCVISVRTQDGNVAEPRDKDPASVNRHMSKHFEMATLNGNGLILLEDMLIDVYIPLLAYFEQRLSYIPSTEALEPVASQKSVDRSSSKSSEGKVSTSTGVAFTLLRDEFMHQLHKFKAAIGVVKEHLEARVHLVVPSHLHLEDSVEDNLANIELLEQVEEVCIDWFRQVSGFF